MPADIPVSLHSSSV